jgi:hypothetical protein
MFWNGSTTIEGFPGSASIGAAGFASAGLPIWIL